MGLTFNVVDELPVIAHRSQGVFEPKLTRTFHWNGPTSIPEDVDPLEVILGDANYHINKDWNDEQTGVQGGDGIMYHKLIARNGDLYVVRPTDAILWSCGNAWGNQTSEHVQVMCGGDQAPTSAQHDTMAALASDGLESLPHKFWSPTACPGPIIEQWIIEGLGEMITREEFEAYKKDIDTTIEAMKKAYDRLYHHIHADDPIFDKQTSEPFFPPVHGAALSGEDSQDPHGEVFWVYPGESTPRLG